MIKVNWKRTCIFCGHLCEKWYDLHQTNAKMINRQCTHKAYRQIQFASGNVYFFYNLL